MIKKLIKVARIFIALILVCVGGSFPVIAGSSTDLTTGSFQYLPKNSKLSTSGTTRIFLPLVEKVHYSPAPLWRFGVSFTQNPISAYDTAGLSAMRFGWYEDYNVNSSAATPNGIEYVPMVRVKQWKVAADNSTLTSCRPGPYYADPPIFDVSPSITDIAKIAYKQTGMTWIIGNEIDRVDTGSVDSCGRQDEITPELYAVAYHDIYYAIKNADPTAKVAIGSMVQFTNLRREYLDKVWVEYSRLANLPGNEATGPDKIMQVDVWNTHLYVVQEVSCQDQSQSGNCWGAEVPPEASQLIGETYTMLDMKNFSIAWGQIVEFRKWMQAHGQQEKPLIISEYGILWPSWLGCNSYPETEGCPFTPEEVAIGYMVPSFNAFLAQPDPGSHVISTDPSSPTYQAIGFTADGYRLVQRWNWFSGDYDEGECDQGLVYVNFGGALFHSGKPVAVTDGTPCSYPSIGLTPLGTYWKQFVGSLPEGSAIPYNP